MSNHVIHTASTQRSLVILGIALTVLVACGGPEPPAPAQPTTPPEPTAALTAEPTPTPEPSATPSKEPTPTPEPTATPEEEAEYVTYQHPTGSFSVDMPQGVEYDEGEEGTIFSDNESFWMEISFTVLESPLDPAVLEAAIPDILDQMLLEEAPIASYEIIDVESTEGGDVVATAFTFASAELGDGEGNLILRQTGQAVYQMIAISLDDSGLFEKVWQRAVDTFAPMSAEPAAPPTSEPTSTPEPTQTATTEPTPTPEPTATPEEEAKSEYVTYQHPTGSFSVDMPKGVEYDEGEEGTIFSDNESFWMEISIILLESPLDPAELEAAIPDILDQILLEEGRISSYEVVKVESTEGGDEVAAAFTFASAELGDGEGNLILRQTGQAVYQMIAISLEDSGLFGEVWQKALDSFAPTPVGPGAAPAADTPVPPTAAATPKSAATPRPQPTAAPIPPTAPPPSAGQGCYLIQNHLGVELTATFTARDWQWNDTFSIPANTEKEYCLDPGRYTYTIDAPPPWDDINGELEVQAGDRLLFPLSGE